MFFLQISCQSIFFSLANEYCYKKAEFGMQISLIWKYMFLITYKPLVCYWLGTNADLKSQARSCTAGYNVQWEWPEAKMKKKIGTFLLYSYFFLYSLTSRHFIWSTTKLFDQPLVITGKNDRISCLRIDRYSIPLVNIFDYSTYILGRIQIWPYFENLVTIRSIF